MSGQNAAVPEFCYDIPRLLLLFEGLGRQLRLWGHPARVGIEPFGLFRFRDLQGHGRGCAAAHALPMPGRA